MVGRRPGVLDLGVRVSSWRLGQGAGMPGFKMVTGSCSWPLGKSTCRYSGYTGAP
jgi:phage-related protein